ncbi:MAG: formylglycine-generating enzyme family protein [Planctomycetes bacterium]|nr:formylglycine-generating enzyme family protein [Planctomycetota bacterium]
MAAGMNLRLEMPAGMKRTAVLNCKRKKEMATILRIVTGVLAVAGILAFVVQAPADEQTSTIVRPASQPASKPFDFQEARNVVASYAKQAGIKEIQVSLDMGNKVTMKLALIPPGEFLMGSPKTEEGRGDNEGPQHEVIISRSFYMGVFEVTQEQYEAIIGKNPSNFRNPKNPVEQVTWADAVEFCKKLSQKTGKTVRLPTEAEWEYACRAGSKTRFFFGDDSDKLGDYAWYFRNTPKPETHPVGQKNPNPWGLYDILGNAWEWCSDFNGAYDDKKQTDPSGPKSGESRVMRGGCRGNDVRYFRSALRDACAVSDYSIGFRVVLEIKKP